MDIDAKGTGKLTKTGRQLARILAGRPECDGIQISEDGRAVYVVKNGTAIRLSQEEVLKFNQALARARAEAEKEAVSQKAEIDNLNQLLGPVRAEDTDAGWVNSDDKRQD